MQRWRQRHGLFLKVVLGIVLANYLAQIPYYLHLYYFPYGAPPRLSGTILLGLTLVWFLVGYVGLARGSRWGYWLLVAFLVTEVGFYASNMLVQVTHGYPPFLHLDISDPILFAVFGIGYLNLFAGAYFLYFLAQHRRTLVASGATASASGVTG
jgi:hypothetical protein